MLVQHGTNETSGPTFANPAFIAHGNKMAESLDASNSIQVGIDGTWPPVSRSFFADGSLYQAQLRQLERDGLMRRRQQQQKEQEEIRREYKHVYGYTGDDDTRDHNASKPDTQHSKARNGMHVTTAPLSPSPCGDCLVMSAETVRSVLAALSDLLSQPLFSRSSQESAQEPSPSQTPLSSSSSTCNLMPSLSADTHLHGGCTKKHSIEILQDHCRGFVDDQDHNLRPHDRSTELGCSYDTANNRW
eukprot:CAMPEP_0198116896 /NCGR_PEP_ID=MMETSP1442-20131203/15241_1 /TAXON_ID= /ORGANISM="Craspedostauros australis, Strain CCMP3328" /LENGTH=244 /DNA_ID=CAMNT_0043774825 /DNA_START=384 /DNA_END=1115 /DNA_ORIENTATION=-